MQLFGCANLIVFLWCRWGYVLLLTTNGNKKIYRDVLNFCLCVTLIVGKQSVTFLWYRCAKRNFLFGRQKESHQRKTLGYVLILLRVVLLVGPVVAGSALMPIGEAERRVVLLPNV